jgi:hypothetical protein
MNKTEFEYRSELAQLRGKLNAIARIARDPELIRHEFMRNNVLESLIEIADEQEELSNDQQSYSVEQEDGCFSSESARKLITSAWV